MAAKVSRLRTGGIFVGVAYGVTGELHFGEWNAIGSVDRLRKLREQKDP